MRRVRLPVERIKWYHIGAPWSPAHITLGEADAVVWCAEDRLRRVSDDNNRFIHPLDSAACVAAFSKGRSSSLQINQRCRKVGAISIAGGHDVFYPWVPSEENPADTPSRWFETKPGAGDDDQPELSADEWDLRGLAVWPEDAVFFIHLCSGPDRHLDLVDAVERYGAMAGCNVVGIRIDPLAWTSQLADFGCGDLLKHQVGHGILKLIHTRRVIGGFASPPCSTVSAARHVPMQMRGGPRPLRSRGECWDPLPYCTAKEIASVRIGSALYLLCLCLLGEIRTFGGWIGLEHPADRQREPFPSFFNTDEVEFFKRYCKVKYWVLDQCRFGAVSRKPTGMLLAYNSSGFAKRCNHVHGHTSLIGLDAFGGFKTTPAAHYPQQLCWELAKLCVSQLVVALQAGCAVPHKPIPLSNQDVKDPWTNTINVSFPWPQPRANFLAEQLAAINSREVHQLATSPQQ